MKPLFTLLFLTVAAACLAQQRPNAYFLTNDGRYVSSKDSADFVRVITQPTTDGDMYTITEFYKSGKRKLAGKSTVDDPPKFEGIVISSYENGTRKAVNNYKDGLLLGEQYEFFPNGKPYVVKNYTGNITIPVMREFLITGSYDSLGTALVTDRNGHYKGYDPSFKEINEEGNIKDGKRDGEWKFQDSTSTRVEIYNAGKFVSGTRTNKKGEITKYTVAETPPAFPRGVQAFNGYLAKTIKYPEADRRSSIQGKVIVTFTVEKNGKVTDVEVMRGVSPAIDAEAVRAIENSPPWIPGVQYGEVARAKFTIPVSFSLGHP